MSARPFPRGIAAACGLLLLLGLVATLTIPNLHPPFGREATPPDLRQRGPMNGSVEFSREGPGAVVAPAFTPPGIPSLILVYTFGGSTFAQPYYPQGLLWTDPSTAVLSYLFAVPGGSSTVYVVGIPPGWIYQGAGPGALSVVSGAVFYTSFNATPTDGGDLFDLQLLAPLPPDPIYTALAGDVSAILSSIAGTNATVQTRVAAAQVLIREGLQEANATYVYRLQPGSATLQSGTIYTVPVFVALLSGGLANATVTGKAAAGLSLSFVGPQGTTVTPRWSTAPAGTGSFALSVNLTSAQVSQVQSGLGVVTLSAPVTIGGFTNLAGGVIAASSFTNASEPAGWWSTIFGISAPPPSTNPSTIEDVLADLAWFGDSTAGRAMYALVTLVAILSYFLAAHRIARKTVSGAPRRRGVEVRPA